MLSEMENIRAEFTTEILKRKGVEEELERTKTALWAIVASQPDRKIFIPDVALARKYKFNIYRTINDQGIVIEADVDE